MSSESDKKSSWFRQAVYLAIIVICILLLLRCSGTFKNASNGDGGAERAQELPASSREPVIASSSDQLQAHKETPVFKADNEPKEVKVDPGTVVQKKKTPPVLSAAKTDSHPVKSPSDGKSEEKEIVKARPGRAGEASATLAGGPWKKDLEQRPEPEKALSGAGESSSIKGEVVGPVTSAVALQQTASANATPSTQPDMSESIKIKPSRNMCPGGPATGESVTKVAAPSGEFFTDPFTGMRFVRVKGGCFNMGSNNGDPDEKPVHEVCVDDFYLGEFEVTQEQFEWIAGYNPSSFWGCDRPVDSVSWEDVQIYLRKFNRASGRNYRLPSEAEWEYAARGGLRQKAFAAALTGNKELLMEYAGYVENLGKQDAYAERGPNELGLYDMTYNVWEWVSDWYGANYYAKSPRINPQGPRSGSQRVIRAGSGTRSEPQLAERYGATPDKAYNYFGFRVAFKAMVLADSQQKERQAEISGTAVPASVVEPKENKQGSAENG